MREVTFTAYSLCGSYAWTRVKGLSIFLFFFFCLPWLGERWRFTIYLQWQARGAKGCRKDALYCRRSPQLIRRIACCTVLLFFLPFVFQYNCAFDYSDLALGCDKGGGNLIPSLFLSRFSLTPWTLTCVLPVTPHTSVSLLPL